MDVLSSFYPHLDSTNKLKPKIFGCISFVHVHGNERGKLDPRAVKCVFLGYSTTQKGYKCFHPPSKRFFVSRYVTFNEQESCFQPHLQGESVREEDESLILPNLAFGPEIGTETERGIKQTPKPVVGPEQTLRPIAGTEPKPKPIAGPEQAPKPVAGPKQTLRPIAGTEQAPKPAAELAPSNGRKFGKILVYSRREKAIPKSIHVQESNPSLQEVKVSNPINSNNSNEFVLDDSKAHVDQNLDLPIALRKGTRTCT